MALVRCRTTSKYGRTVETYIDTDDLDDLSYHYYRKAQKLNLVMLARLILRGSITGSEIEDNPEKYKEIID